jgi:hypothetical protein
MSIKLFNTNKVTFIVPTNFCNFLMLFGKTYPQSIKFSYMPFQPNRQRKYQSCQGKIFASKLKNK